MSKTASGASRGSGCRWPKEAYRAAAAKAATAMAPERRSRRASRAGRVWFMPLLAAASLARADAGASGPTTPSATVVIKESCGVSGVFTRTWKASAPKSNQELKCDIMMTTNCSISYSPIKCPDKCPFVAPNHAFPCMFACVEPELCSAHNPNRAFPDPKSNLCSHCPIVGCKVCSSHTKCSACHSGFNPTEDGRCIFHLDGTVNWFKVIFSTATVVLSLVLLAVLWRLVKGVHPRWESNLASILRARRHRIMTKVHNWKLGDPRTVHERHDLAMDVHRKNILGVGVPLFYNNICFLALVAALCLWVTFMTYRVSGMGNLLAKVDDQDAWLTKGTWQLEGDMPAVIASPLAVCGAQTPADSKMHLQKFAVYNCVGVGFLYVVTFVMSLVYGSVQKRSSLRFDKENLGMNDYAIRLTGLPADLTDEAELAGWLQKSFREACPGLYNRPPSVTHKGPTENDEVKERPSSAIEVAGVSICYDYRDRVGTVDDIVWTLLEQMEVEMYEKSRTDPLPVFAGSTTAAERGVTLEKMDEQNRERASVLFEGENKLKSSGEVFVIFNYITDKEAVQSYYNSNPNALKHPSAPQSKIKLKDVFSEPHCIAWWYVGMPKSTLIRRTCLMIFKIFLVILAVQVVLVLPYAHFIVWPYSKVGTAAGGMKMSIAGIVLGNVNGILFMTNFLTAMHVGYPRKDAMDTFVLGANTLLCMVNTLFNIVTNTIMVLSGNNVKDDTWSRFFQLETVRAIGTENELARNLFKMMTPGAFFSGLIMAMIMAGWVPWAWNTFLMKLIYVWKPLPDCLLKVLKVFLPWAPGGIDILPSRSAEKAMEPWEVAICGNYADHIVTPTVCFSFLFFLSPYVWKIFLMMLLWTIFEYVYFRYMHLRYCKACFYSTDRLDTFSNILWGIPLSVLASAWCFWGIRADLVLHNYSVSAKFAAITGCFSLSLLLWVVSYIYGIRPFDESDAKEDNNQTHLSELTSETVYSWFNCNPPYVLKCKYHFLDKAGKDIPNRRKGHQLACGEDKSEVRFFEVGRQGLFVKPERQPLVHRHTKDWMEFETWFELCLQMWTALVSPCRRRSTGSSRQLGDTQYGLLETPNGP